MTRPIHSTRTLERLITDLGKLEVRAMAATAPTRLQRAGRLFSFDSPEAEQNRKALLLNGTALVIAERFHIVGQTMAAMRPDGAPILWTSQPMPADLVDPAALVGFRLESALAGRRVVFCHEGYCLIAAMISPGAYARLEVVE